MIASVKFKAVMKCQNGHKGAAFWDIVRFGEMKNLRFDPSCTCPTGEMDEGYEQLGNPLIEISGEWCDITNESFKV